MIRELWNGGWPGRLMLACVAMIVLVIPLVVIAEVQERGRWRAFAEAHDCKVVGKIRGGVQTGIGAGIGTNGQVMTSLIALSEPDKTGYACNDGVTYWR